MNPPDKTNPWTDIWRSDIRQRVQARRATTNPGAPTMTEPTVATEKSVVDEAIELACNDIVADITHHLDWLETQKPGISLAFACSLIQTLQAGVMLAVEGDSPNPPPGSGPNVDAAP